MLFNISLGRRDEKSYLYNLFKVLLGFQHHYLSYHLDSPNVSIENILFVGELAQACNRRILDLVKAGLDCSKKNLRMENLLHLIIASYEMNNEKLKAFLLKKERQLLNKINKDLHLELVKCFATSKNCKLPDKGGVTPLQKAKKSAHIAIYNYLYRLAVQRDKKSLSL